MIDRLLRMAEVEATIGKKKSWIYEELRLGRFPKPVKLGSSTRWPESRIQKYIEDLMDETA